jgi:hypothetical protein
MPAKALAQFKITQAVSIILRRLLDEPVSGLAQRVYQRDPIALRLVHESTTQAVGAEISRIQPGHLAAFLQDQTAGLGRQRSRARGAFRRTSCKIGSEVSLAKRILSWRQDSHPSCREDRGPLPGLGSLRAA